MSQIQNILDLIAASRLDEALEALTALIDSGRGDAEVYFTRGKVYWRLGQRSRATTDYATAVELDPSSPAARALEHARDVESFFNPDLYNP